MTPAPEVRCTTCETKIATRVDAGYEVRQHRGNGYRVPDITEYWCRKCRVWVPLPPVA